MKTDDEVRKDFSKYKNVRITSSQAYGERPYVHDIFVRDSETGEMIPGIVRIELEIDAEYNACHGTMYIAKPIMIDELDTNALMETKETELLRHKKNQSETPIK